MNSGWSVMVACNDSRNGVFAGNASSFDFVSPDQETALEFHLFPPAQFNLTSRDLIIGKPGKRKPFPYSKSNDWCGNWCWNEYWCDDATIARLIRLCWRNVNPEVGWCSLIDAHKCGERITGKLLRRVMKEAV